VLLLKDIHNLRATVNERQRDVSSALSEHAASNPNDDVWLLIDDTSTAAMKERSCDVRRHLLDKQLWDAFVCFLVQDGHGHGQLVGLYLLAGEDSSQMWVILNSAQLNVNLQTQVKHLIVRIYLSKLNTKLYVTYYSY